MKSFVIASAAGLALAAGTAHGAFFSFAADTSNQSWTYTGNGNAITAATTAPILLNIDDNNGPAPMMQVSTTLTASYTLTFVGSTPLPGGALAMTYAANGSFILTDTAAGVALLTTNFSNALFSVRASTNNVWASTASLQVDDGLGASVSMVWGGANLPAFGLAPGALTGSPRGFAFDMSSLNSSGVMPYAGQSPGVPINATSRFPTQPWFAESSFTASANVIPAPGSLALLGIGGLLARRRTR